LPPEDVANLGQAAPFDRHPGEPPAMGEDDIQDIVVFLQTLSDWLSIDEAGDPRRTLLYRSKGAYRKRT